MRNLIPMNVCVQASLEGPDIVINHIDASIDKRSISWVGDACGVKIPQRNWRANKLGRCDCLAQDTKKLVDTAVCVSHDKKRNGNLVKYVKLHQQT